MGNMEEGDSRLTFKTTLKRVTGGRMREKRSVTVKSCDEVVAIWTRAPGKPRKEFRCATTTTEDLQ